MRGTTVHTQMWMKCFRIFKSPSWLKGFLAPMLVSLGTGTCQKQALTTFLFSPRK